MIDDCEWAVGVWVVVMIACVVCGLVALGVGVWIALASIVAVVVLYGSLVLFA